jgi:hypothetical protein
LTVSPHFWAEGPRRLVLEELPQLPANSRRHTSVRRVTTVLPRTLDVIEQDSACNSDDVMCYE